MAIKNLRPLTRRDALNIFGMSTLVGAMAGANNLMAQEIIADHLMGMGNSDYVDYARRGLFRTNNNPTMTWIGEVDTIRANGEVNQKQVVVTTAQDNPTPRLIVFSHGAITEPMLYRYLLNHWSTHGFIVVAPIHDDSVIKQGLEIRQQDARGATSWDFSGLLNDHNLWEDRTSVCSLVLDNVGILNETFSIAINDERPIIAGHSYGSFTSQLLLGAEVNTANGLRSFKDPRWAGGMLLSPQGVGIMGLHEKSWNEVNRPLLVMTGGRDVDNSEQDAARKADAYWYSPEQYKHFAYMEYGTHNIFTGQSARPGNYDQRLFADIRAVTTAFLKAYAEHDTKAYSHLLDDYFSVMTVEYEEQSPDRNKHSRIFMQNR